MRKILSLSIAVAAIPFAAATLLVAASALALAAACTVALAPPADAQQRKSIRWAVASIDTYGYKVAAAVAR